jgi:acyl-homoserine-lactone acylase
LLLLVIWLSACAIQPVQPASPSELLWDRWGVPHIFAPDSRAAFYALGYAQMQSQGELLLQGYALARGRGAAFFGPTAYATDQTTWRLDIPARGQRWYDRQTPAFRRLIDAFVTGVNAYGQGHPERLSPANQAILPVTGADLFAHLARLLAILVITYSDCVILFPDLALARPPASMGWAIAPARTAHGNSLLWGDLQWATPGLPPLYEAHLTIPQLNLYGITWLGLPVLTSGFTDHLGWIHTLAASDGCDRYTLSVTGGDPPTAYLLDGEPHPLTTLTHTIQVKQMDGALVTLPFVSAHSLHGPVVEQTEQQMAVRLLGQEESPASGLLEQWWQMAISAKLADFQQALRRVQLPNLHTLYADGGGHLLFLGGNLPQRSSGGVDFWSLPVPGDNTRWLWSHAHAYGDLPQVTDPASGWLQASSGPPWFATLPALNATGYPVYFAAQPLTASPTFLREQRGLRWLSRAERVSLEQMAAVTQSTGAELADRLIEPLLYAAQQSNNKLTQQAAIVLARWDHQLAPYSQGLVLFALWRHHWRQQSWMKLSAANPMLHNAHSLGGSALFYATPWEASNPLESPQGLFSPLIAVQALETAARQLQTWGAPLEASWNEVAHLPGVKVPWPADVQGEWGVLGASDWLTNQANMAEHHSYYLLVELGETVRGLVRMQPSAQVRPALRQRSEIEAHLLKHEVLWYTERK